MYHKLLCVFAFPSECDCFMLQYLRGGLGDCVFGFVYLMELSTPFVSFRGILSRLKVSQCLFH